MTTTQTTFPTPYSQRDPAWRNAVFAGGLTFARAGCYVTALAMKASTVGSQLTPPQIAQLLRSARIFSGAQLIHPERVPAVIPALVWQGRTDWRARPADLATLDHMLAHWGPQIIETEFRPGGDRPPADQHFVLALAFTFGRGDLIIIDPWDGAQTHLLERYALDSWDLARAIFGVRAFSPAHDPSTP